MIADATLERVLPPRTVALLGDLIRALLWGAVALVWLVFGQIYARLWRLTLVDPANSDFTIFYFSARLHADGLPMYGASPARYGIPWVADYIGNLNPPHFQLAVQPLAWLTYEQAYVAWTAANLAALVASVFVAVRALGGEITWRGLLILGRRADERGAVHHRRGHVGADVSPHAAGHAVVGGSAQGTVGSRRRVAGALHQPQAVLPALPALAALASPVAGYRHLRSVDWPARPRSVPSHTVRACTSNGLNHSGRSAGGGWR